MGLKKSFVQTNLNYFKKCLQFLSNLFQPQNLKFVSDLHCFKNIRVIDSVDDSFECPPDINSRWLDLDPV